MPKTRVVLWLLLMLPIVASSQVTCETPMPGPGREVSGSPAPIFALKKPFEHPVALPSLVLALFRADAESSAKFEACRSRENLPQIPAKWFLASEIKMAKDELPGLLVRVADSCLWEKEQDQKVGEFWLFRQSPTGYQLIFQERTQALQVLNTHTNGYPDLCTSWGHFGQYNQTIYTFQQGKYLPYSYGLLIFDPPPPPPTPPPIPR